MRAILFAFTLLASSLSTAAPHIGDTANEAKDASPPTYDIAVRAENGDYFEGLGRPDFAKERPWATFRPAPFYYRSDRDAAATAKATPFLVGGVNCDTTLAKMPTLTGVSLENLAIRARGHAEHMQFGHYADEPAWRGVGNVNMRSSGDGFLERKPEYLYHKGETAAHRAQAHGAMRELLRKDNAEVKQLGLTHQIIAAPLLQAIEAHQYDGRSIVDIGGERFSVSSEQMGGAVDLIRLDRPSPEMLRARQSGWTGKGVQGSLFNDEIYSNRLYTLTRVNPKPGQEPSITIDGVTPHLIHRYGFYQGGEYRTAPQKIASFFGLKATEESRAAWAACE